MEEKLTLSPLSFAFVGDAYMSLVIRRMLLEKGDMPVNKFHKASVKYVSADAQAAVHDALLEKEFLTEEEKEVMHRGKNHAHPTGRGANYGMKDYLSNGDISDEILSKFFIYVRNSDSSVINYTSCSAINV